MTTGESLKRPGMPASRVSEGGVPWRKTFLRRHLAKELLDPSDIPLIGDLTKISGQSDSFTPKDFFFAHQPYRLYQPLKIRPLHIDKALGDGYTDQNNHSAIFDLTGLIQVLRDRPDDGRSVLLEARSGAGKTVAVRAALLDCFYGVDDQQPRLAGYLGCPLSIASGGKIARDKRNRLIPADIICERLAELGEIDSENGARLVEQWLEIGPPLLLLVDLNPIRPKLRRRVARNLVEFLRRSQAKNLGHRAVVTYRSHAEDTTLLELREASWEQSRPSDQNRIFVRADLEPLDSRVAPRYFLSLRNVEALLKGSEIDEIKLTEQVNKEVEAVQELVNRFDHVDGSLVSTPLLLYFVGSVGETLKKARSLAELYDIVVSKFLEREESFSRNTLIHFDSRSIRLAMGRVALVILAQGSGTTRLSGDLATARKMNRLFLEPQKAFKTLLPKEKKGWLADFLQGSPYVIEDIKEPFLDEARPSHGIGQRSLLRKTGNQIGFLHDSFLYYFVAQALLYHQDPPPEPPPDTVDEEWHAAIVQWWLSGDPSTWTAIAEFLGGMLNHDDLLGLAATLLVADSTTGSPELLRHLVTGRSRETNQLKEKLLAELERATRRAVVSRFPSCLLNHVVNWLSDAAQYDGETGQFLTGKLFPLITTRDPKLPPLLISNPPARRPSFQEHRCHRTRVLMIEVLPDGRAVSVDANDQLVLWDPIQGDAILLPNSLSRRSGASSPRQLITLPQNFLLYRASDGGTTIYQLPERDKWYGAIAERIKEHDSQQNSPKVPNRRLTVGEKLGMSMVRMDPSETIGSRLIWLKMPDGQLIVREETGVVSMVRIDPTGKVSDRRELFRHKGQASGPLEWLNATLVQSWSDDGLILWSDREKRVVDQTDFHPWKPMFTGRLADGTIVAAATRGNSEVGEVVVWNPSEGNAPRKVYDHGEIIIGLMTTSQGWVVSWSTASHIPSYGPILVLAWKPGMEQPIPINPENRGVRFVHELRDGGILIVGRSSLKVHDGKSLKLVNQCDSLIQSIKLVQPLPDEETFVLAGESGLATYCPRTHVQKWITISRYEESFHPQVLQTGWGGRVFVGFPEGRVSYWNSKNTLKETRTWNEIATAEHQRTVASPEEPWDREIWDVFEKESWMIWGTRKGNVGWTDGRVERVDNKNRPVEMLHQGPIVAVGMLPDGRLFSLSCGNPSRLVTIDPSSDEFSLENIPIEVPEFDNPARLLRLKNGSIVIPTANHDCPAILWDTHTLRFQLFSKSDTSLWTHIEALSTNEFITANLTGEMVLWDCSHGRLQGRTLYKQDNPIEQMIPTLDKHIISSDYLKLLYWSQAPVPEILDRVPNLDRLVELRDGRILFGNRRKLIVRSLRSREVISIERIRQEVYRPIWQKVCRPFVLNSGQVAYGDEQGYVKIWTPPSLAIPHCPESKVMRMAAISDGRLALLHQDGWLSTWNPSSKVSESGPHVEGDIVALVASGNDRVLLGCADGRLLSWRGGQAGCVEYAPLPEGLVGLKRLDDGRILLFGRDGSIRDWESRRLLIQHNRPVTTAEILVDGKVVLLDDLGQLSVIDPTNQSTSQIDNAGRPLTAMAGLQLIRIDDQILWSSEVFVLTSGQLLMSWHSRSHYLSELSTLPSSPTLIRKQPDGQILLGFQDGTVGIYHSENFKVGLVLLALWDDHTAEVVEIVNLDDGRFASLDCSGRIVVRSWKPEKDLVVAHKHDQEVIGLLELPDGWLVSASEDRTIAFYHPETRTVSILPIDHPIRELRLSQLDYLPEPCLVVVLERGPLLFISKEIRLIRNDS